jgi:hypothetical protein
VIATVSAVTIAVGLLIWAGRSYFSGPERRGYVGDSSPTLFLADRAQRKTAADTATLASLDAAITAAEWRWYSSTVGAFRVLMPGTPTGPTSDTDPAPGARSYAFSARATVPNGTIWCNVGWLEYPFDVPADYLLAGQDSAVEAAKGRLVSSEALRVGSMSCREFTVEGQAFTARSRLCTHGARLYEVTAAFTAGPPVDADVSRFLNSFSLVQ